MKNFIRFVYGVLDVVRDGFEPRQISLAPSTPLRTFGVGAENVQRFREALERKFGITLDSGAAFEWSRVDDVCNALGEAGALGHPQDEAEADRMFPGDAVL